MKLKSEWFAGNNHRLKWKRQLTVVAVLLLMASFTTPIQAADTTCAAGKYLRHGSVCSDCEPGNYCPGGA